MSNETIDCQLPLADEGVPPASRVASAKPIRVLQVEDDAGDAVRAHRCLQGQIAADSRIDRVSTLAGALGRLEQESYDLILLDLTLPDSEGIDALNTVAHRHSSTPILVLSDKEQPEDVQRAICGGTRQFPLMPMYYTFLKAATLVAIFEEAFFRRSYDDCFVPEHVRQVTWHW